MVGGAAMICKIAFALWLALSFPLGVLTGKAIRKMREGRHDR
jgi:hypothetical protein